MCDHTCWFEWSLVFPCDFPLVSLLVFFVFFVGSTPFVKDRPIRVPNLHHRGKKFVPFGASLGISFSQTRASHNNRDVSVGSVPPLGTKQYPLPLIKFNNCWVSTLNNRSVVFNFGIFWGSFGHFYIATGFSKHFICIIKIWATCTFSSAYKLVENLNVCPWLHA